MDLVWDNDIFAVTVEPEVEEDEEALSDGWDAIGNLQD